MHDQSVRDMLTVTFLLREECRRSVPRCRGGRATLKAASAALGNKGVDGKSAPP
jgi:hypothetical protein